MSPHDCRLAVLTSRNVFARAIIHCLWPTESGVSVQEVNLVQVADYDFMSEALANATLVLIDLTHARSSPVELALLDAAERIRLKHRFKRPVVFCGFAARESLSTGMGMLSPLATGSGYLRLPIRRDELTTVLEDNSCLTEDEWQKVAFRYCGPARELRGILHDVTNAVTCDARVVGEVSPATRLASAQARVHSFLRLLHDTELGAYDIAKQSLELERLLGGPGMPEGRSELLTLIQALDDELTRGDGRARTDEGTSACAPDGYEIILVADDDGYPEECLAYLAGLGYSVDVVTSYGDTLSMLHADPPRVFVADQTFGNDSGAGRRLMRVAREASECRVVIAISGSTLSCAEAPDADAICAGARAKTIDGARQVHQAILRHARGGRPFLR